MNRADRAWALIYWVVLATVTSIPYVVAARSEGGDWQFTGFLIGVEDGNSYIAKLRSGSEGAWLFRSPYTTVDQPGVLAFLPYLMLGKLAGNNHEALVLAFHAFRVAALLPLILAVYRFVGCFVVQREWRRWATMAATAGGGLGWALILLGQPDWLGSLPLEFYSPETYGFLAVFGLPHLVLARALMLAALTSYLRSAGRWMPGLLLLLVGMVHPPSLVTAVAVLAAHQIAEQAFTRQRSERAGRAARLGRALLPSAPLVAYLIAAYLRDPFLQAWARQNLILSPHPAHYLVGVGIVIPFTIAGAIRALRRMDPDILLPVAWAVVLPFLAYAPVNLQRRLPEAGWVALLTLAAIALEQLGPRFQGSAGIGAALLLLPSTLLLLLAAAQTAARPGPPAFRATAEVTAFEWLAQNSESGDVVLASYATGNALPAWAPVRVVVGHGPETAGLALLLPRVESFFAGRLSPDQRLAFLREQSVDFIFFGPAEQALGSWDLSTWDCLSRVYERSGYTLFAACTGLDA